MRVQDEPRYGVLCVVTEGWRSASGAQIDAGDLSGRAQPRADGVCNLDVWGQGARSSRPITRPRLC